MSQKIVFMGTPEFSVPTLESLVKSNHKIVNYDKINAIFTELLGPISYASSSKNVFTEQYFLLVVTEKKDQTNLYSLPTFHGGICNGV